MPADRQKVRYAADLPLYCLAARLGRVGGEDWMEFQLFQELACPGGPHFVNKLFIRNRQGIHGVGGGPCVNSIFARKQYGDAVVLFAQVRQVEVCGKSPCQCLSLFHRTAVNQGDSFFHAPHRCIMEVRGICSIVEALFVCHYNVFPQGIKHLEDMRVIFA